MKIQAKKNLLYDISLVLVTIIQSKNYSENSKQKKKICLILV